MAGLQYKYVVRKYSVAGQSGTVTFDLPEKGFIPEIIVRAFSTPTASTNPALPLNDAITKIEIVDGSKVIKSLSGNQIRALQMIWDRKELTLTDTDANGTEGYGDFKIILGAMINGKKYAPDFSKFSNPQIKISWDYSQTDVKGATYDADTDPAMKFTVITLIDRENVSGFTHGYIKSSVIKTITQSPSTTHVVEIPRGDPLLGIGIEAGYNGLDWTEDVEVVKLDFDNGAWIPFELYEEEIPTIMDVWFDGPFEVNFTKDLKDSVDVDLHMGYVKTAHFMTTSGAGRSAEWANGTQGIGSFTLFDVATPTAIAAYEQVGVYARGYIPFNVWYVPMRAILGNGHDTVDTTKYGRIELSFTSGASANTSSRPEVIAEYLIVR